MIRLTTLPNGLRIVTESMPGLESATVGIWIGAGGRHERAEQNGIAHFLEHMAFKGTATRSALRIAEEIEDVGGYINAYTARETTAYYARVLKADVGLALDILSDIVLHPAFDPREIEVERGVILQEIGQALDTPDDVIFDWLQEAAFPDQPMGRSILGLSDRVARFARADLAGFVADHYGPDRMIVSAAGAVDHDAVVAQVQAAFGDLAQRPPGPLEPARFHTGERREMRDLEQVHLALAFDAPAWRDPQLHVAQVWSQAMGGGMSSRLFQKIREERGLCYSIFTQGSAHEDCGTITLYAGTGAEEVPELVELTVTELRRAADDLGAAEVARAKAQLRAGLLMGLESPTGRAERMARLLAIWGRVPPPEETVALIDAVTVEAARDFGARLARRARVALALYGPVDRAPWLHEIRERLAA
ncbi:MAG: M16 family metallopeptidase [Gemmobacter sp.]